MYNIYYILSSDKAVWLIKKSALPVDAAFLYDRVYREVPCRDTINYTPVAVDKVPLSVYAMNLRSSEQTAWQSKVCY